MIKKLEKRIGTIKAGNMTYDAMKPASINEMHEKINELVDAVNELQKNATISKMEKVEPADPYAEQRKWIGKLCRFRDNPVCEWKYGILEKFYEDTAYPFLDTDGYEYVECEPVKPDDDIIYKGGDK